MRLLWVGLCAASYVAASGDLEEKVRAALQKVADSKSAEYDCGIAISARHPSFEPVSVAGGIQDLKKKLPMQHDSKFVWGSVTKLVTGSSILRLADAGVFSLDDPVAPLVDPIIKRMVEAQPKGKYNFSALADLFGPKANEVTIRQLATMQSGIPDYDTAKPNEENRSLSVDPFRAQCYKQPSKDYSPLDMLAVPWVHTGHLVDPDYSSTNFLLLGLVLAQHAGAESWEKYDQGTFGTGLPATFKAMGFMNNTQYAATGGPSDYTPMRGYDRTSYNNHTPDTPPGTDVGDVHGDFAGWTASDIVAPVGDVADLCHAIYGSLGLAPDNNNRHTDTDADADADADSPFLITPADARMIVNTSHFYGFATFMLAPYTGQPAGIYAEPGKDYGSAYGHLGATYGYNSMVATVPGLNLTIAVGTNVETDYQAQPSDAFCVAFNKVKGLILDEPAAASNCSYVASGYFGGCRCESTRYKCVPHTYHGHTSGRCEPAYDGTQNFEECGRTCK